MDRNKEIQVLLVKIGNMLDNTSNELEELNIMVNEFGELVKKLEEMEKIIKRWEDIS